MKLFLFPLEHGRQTMAGPLSQMPTRLHPDPKSDNTVAEEFVERVDGETSFDQIAKAQSSMPHVVKRVTDLENCIWALAEELGKHDPRNPQIEQAKLLLKNKLEVFDSSKPFQDSAEKDAFDSFTSLGLGRKAL
jgi:hypothetical protein